MDNSVGIWSTRYGWYPLFMNENILPSPYLELLALGGSHDGLDPQGSMSCDLL